MLPVSLIRVPVQNTKDVIKVQYSIQNASYTGTLQQSPAVARDNTAASPRQCEYVFRPKMVDYCFMSIFVAATPFRHQGLNFFRIFSCHIISIMLSHCRCREAKNLSRAQLCCTECLSA